MTTTLETQTSLLRTVTTRDRLFTFHWPMPVVVHQTILNVTGDRISTMRKRMNRALQDGYAVRCPVGGSVLRIYRRALTRTHLALLTSLYARSLTDPGWQKLRSFSRGHTDGDLAKMLHWALVERQEDASLWRITDLGKRWLYGAEKIPRHIAIFRAEFLGYWDEADLITPAEVDEAFNRDALFGVVAHAE